MDKLINTTWKLTGDIGLYNCDAMAVTFLDEGYFQYIKILDGKQVDDLYGGPNTQYKSDAHDILINSAEDPSSKFKWPLTL